MKRKLMTLVLTLALATSMLYGCGGSEPAESAPAAEEETVEEEAVEEEAAEEEAAGETEEAESEGESDASDVSYVDGFYANNGEGDDFMIFFYESSAGDVAYVNDGKEEAFAEYTVEKAQLDDGTEYYVVKVGEATLGYYEEGDDIYLISEDGDIYAAGRLTEEEAEALHSVVTE